ncbi:phase kinase-associated protein 1 [Seminavis robusta]|uniref:Phase kinase-associated protein 1 n=1 Tax=Seminavis robusta TaxID=568900 RepID=A0A9N8EVI2_9STRA|nr:phase kinase-associated protein 1 [Seminavis robusta]|eukprot:Sro1805_g298840.1 phase kinase-associated protein 1 (164) ;mRNA; f:18291-18940
MAESGVVNLESREGECFEVPVKVARLSQMIDEMFDEDEDMEDKKVPLPNVSADVLRKVIAFGKHYQEEQMTPIQTPLKSSNIDDLVQKWYAEFVDLPQKQLFELVAAANYLNIKPLLDLTVLAVSILIKGKSAGELREIFNVTSDAADGEGDAAAAGNADGDN